MAEYPRSLITSMRLRNFRSFEDTGELRFSTINYLFGKNSSGKTTLLRTPLLLKQLVNERSLVGGVPFSGPQVDFGSYPEAVFNSERSRDITLSFEVETGRNFRRLPRSLMRYMTSPFETLRIDISLHWNAKHGKPQYNSIQIVNPEDDDTILLEFRRLGPDRIRVDMPTAGGGRVLTGAPELNLASLRALSLELEPDEKFNAGFLEFFSLAITQTLRDITRSIVHIGPLRDMPARAYRIDQLSTSSGSTEHVVGMLVNQPKATNAVSRALRRLGIAKHVDIVQPAPGYAGIVLSNVSGNRRDNLADVGFGASQVLPILVRLALAPPRSLVLVEQPELHLHPEVQGELAEVMLDIALERRLSLFIESHSENMLLRLRRLVANGTVEPDAVKVFVTDKGTVSEARINRKGRIDMGAFPAGFFEEEWEEAMGIIAGGGRHE